MKAGFAPTKRQREMGLRCVAECQAFLRGEIDKRGLTRRIHAITRRPERERQERIRDRGAA